jgi:hypothetical protein
MLNLGNEIFLEFKLINQEYSSIYNEINNKYIELNELQKDKTTTDKALSELDNCIGGLKEL